MKKIFLILCLLYVCFSQQETEPIVDETDLETSELNEYLAEYDGYMDDEDEVLLEWFWSDDDNDYILEPRSPTAMRPVVSPNNNGGVIQAQTLVYKTQNEQFRQEQIRVQQGQQGGIMMI